MCIHDVPPGLYKSLTWDPCCKVFRVGVFGWEGGGEEGGGRQNLVVVLVLLTY